MISSVMDSDDDSDGIVPAANPDDPGEVLLKACEEGNLEVVVKLLKENSTLIHYKDPDGYTGLHRASQSKHAEIVRLLLTHGADIEAKTEDGWTPLLSAAFWNSYECVRALLENHANVNAQSNGGQTALHLCSSQQNSKESMILLLTCPFINPEIRNSNNETAHDLAQRSGKLSYLFELVKDSINKI